MISYRTPEEIEKMRQAGRIVAGAIQEVWKALRPGVSTQELDLLIRDFVLDRGGKLLFYRYRGFPANSCLSINHEVVHGIPKRRRKLAEGDILSVDVGVKIRGYCGDAAWTFPVGEVSDEARRLLAVGHECLQRGIAASRVGQRISDVSRAIQSCAESSGYHVVKKFVGHGIGSQLHEDPQVPNYLEEKPLRHDPALREGMVLAIEPMVNIGTDDVEILDDGWTVVTKDRSLSAHFEHTVAVRGEGPDILTLLEGGAEVG
ncbi:MAG: type I methionyl aminopeptidase [Planctomycetes bacterium]|nr:type I methionyl aminopeptidase [Planctomycetota bacterium]